MVGTITRLLAPAPARSIENPAVPLSAIDLDHPYASSLTGGIVSSSGVTVDSATALTASAVWRAVNLIAWYCAKIPFRGYARLDDGGRRRAPELPGDRLLRLRPNEYMNQFVLRQTMTAHAVLTGRGNAYGYIFRRGNGDPEEILPLDPLATYPVREKGVLWYETPIDGKRTPIPASDILHIHGLGFDGLQGYDILHLAKEAIGGAIGTKKYGNIYFKNSARPSVVLEHPGPKALSEEAKRRLRKSWEQMYQGLDNAHRTAVLEEGLSAKVLSDNIRQSILVDAQMMDIIHISNVTGIPPHLLGHDARTSYASLEQENQSLLDNAIDPWFTIWEAETNAKLLTAEQRTQDTHFFEFDRNAFVRADFATRTAGYNNAIRGGWMSRDEARARENMNPLPNGEGAKYFVPKELAVVGDGDGDEADAAEDLAFKREVVKGFIADGTIGDVLFNLTAGRELLESVNLPTYPDVEEPWLPVVAATGRLVSGETIEDSEGEIVGGDVAGEGVPDTLDGQNDGPNDLNGVADQPDEAAPPPVPPFDNVDLDDDESVRAAYRGVVRAAQARREDALAAHRALIVEALGRMHRRVCTHARKAARRPAGFVGWIEVGLSTDHRGVFVEALTPALRAARALGCPDGRCDAEALADTYFGGTRAALLTVAECQAGELAGAVGAWATGTERSAPESLADRVIGRRVEHQPRGA